MTTSNSIKFIITEEEWLGLSEKKRERITFLLNEYGYDISGMNEEDDDYGWD